jgi:DNA-binding transcriptional regulator YiaG
LKGVTVAECDCGQAVEICDIEGLHYIIAMELLRLDTPLRPSGIRFLRKSMGMNQVDFADFVGVSETTVSHWENGESVGAHREAAMRLFVYVRLLENKPILARIECEPTLFRTIVDAGRAVVSRGECFDKDERVEIEPPFWMLDKQHESSERSGL